MSFRLFDMHCDTPFEAYHKNQGLKSNSLSVSLDKAASFSNYMQVCAIWTDNSLSPSEAYGDFFKILSDFKHKAAAHIVTDKASLCAALDNKMPAFILAVEGLSLLDGDISRLSAMIDCGVKIVLPVWKDISCIGGAYNTNEGLTDFGKEVIKTCL